MFSSKKKLLVGLISCLVVIIGVYALFKNDSSIENIESPLPEEPSSESINKNYSVKKPITSTEDITIIFTGTGEVPANFDAFIDKNQALLEAITTEEDVESLLPYLHSRINSVGIEDGDGYKWLLKDGVEGKNAWDALLGKRWINPNLYLRLSEAANDSEISKDFNNISLLAEIVNQKKDPQAVVYIHQILHDLDEWVFGNNASEEKVSHFGVTNSENGPHKQLIEEYIQQEQ
ncbi:hypothetical protein SAMN05428961_1133 [Paenibacillus sp. OK060]|uniref:hypothetical protein n=1 Tax=Paenibacillus sp. OK060 TaxID=1881034 RepID=UPI00089043E2|nr:hypothetical protein [Paenibacillus sp. OK060]SDM29327.1 hypothetical protein SAMN05428961_1133 [Paenibacillus sp. OK060]